MPHGAWSVGQPLLRHDPPKYGQWNGEFFPAEFVTGVLGDAVTDVEWHGAQLQRDSRSVPWLMTIAGAQEPPGDMLLLHECTLEVPPLYQAACAQ